MNRDEVLQLLEQFFQRSSGRGGPYVDIGRPTTELDGSFDLGDLADELVKKFMSYATAPVVHP